VLLPGRYPDPPARRGRRDGPALRRGGQDRRPRRRRPLHRPDGPCGHRCPGRLRAPPRGAARGPHRSGAPGTPHPGRLHRQEPPDLEPGGGGGSARRNRRGRLGCHHGGGVLIKHLLSIDQLSPSQIELVLKTADSFREVGTRTIKKVPILRGRTVCNLFFESSTRTRISFELAAKRLSADVINFTGDARSSLAKGESFKDTAQTL